MKSDNFIGVAAIIAIVIFIVVAFLSRYNFGPKFADDRHRAGVELNFPDDEMIEYIMPSPDWVPKKLGLYTSKKWPKEKRVIYVKWYDGDADIQAKTLQDWYNGITAHSGITFQVVTDHKQADWIVGFVANNQSWSYVGTDCKYLANAGMQTMNLGWAIRYRNDEYGERHGTNQHEGLHAMGYVHTLQSPACVGTINWQKDFVYAKYAKMGWDKATVDQQVFSPYTAQEVNDDVCDFTSQMCYPVSQGEAKYPNGSWIVVGRNNNQSKIDIARIKADYSTGVVVPDTTKPKPPVSTGGLVSLNKPSTQSTTYNPLPNTNPTIFSSGKANDGLLNTFNHTLVEANPWWQVDLQTSYKISKIVLINRADCCQSRLSNFNIQIDGKIVYTNTKALQGKDSIVIFPNLDGKIVKVQATNNPANYLHLAELYVYSGTVTPPVVVCKDTIYRVIRLVDSVGKVCR